MAGPGRPEIGKPINVRLGAALLTALDDAAERHQKTRAELIREILAKKLLPPRR